MRTEWIERWARLLVRHAIRVTRGSVIKVRGTVEARALMTAVYAELLRAGAHPRMTAVLPELTHLFYTLASREQLGYLSPLDVHEARHCDGFITIKSDTNTRELSTIPAEKQVITMKAAKPLSDIIIKNDNWTLTLYPTAAYAQDADMAMSEFETFVAKALFLDKSDPVAAWQEQERWQAKLVRRLAAAKTVRIVGHDTDLSLSVAGRTVLNDGGHHNIPGGEIFTAPLETSAEGRIRYTYPVVAYGREISDIYLEFARGRVVKASAAKHEEFLHKMLDMDAGARYLGEFGIGTNYGIQRFVRNILFDEKIGGSVHLAVGRSYPKCGGRNKSALHWDMIKDLRQGGMLYFDGTLVQRDGKFLI
ncbi:MAG: aminopeptidase [bacterium]|nr:aminopeptidase [bacterium]